MSDGSLLPCAEGDGGVARMIRLRLNLGSPPMVPTSTSASNVEVNPVKPYHSDEPEELVILGAMEFEVVPADQMDKTKQSKPYDHSEPKKTGEKSLPKTALQLGEPIPNRAYVKLLLAILKHTTPEPVVHPVVEDKVMADVVPTQQKGKQKENPTIVPTSPLAPEAALCKPKLDRVLPPRKAP